MSSVLSENKVRKKKNKSKKENKSDWMYRKGGHVGGKGERAERSRKEDGVRGEEGEV